MKLSRRSLLYLSTGAAALPVVSRIASAQTYPARPVRIIVGVAAGGANSTVARLVAQWLSERLGHEFIVENRPGAGGSVGAQAAANAARTLLSPHGEERGQRPRVSNHGRARGPARGCAPVAAAC
jgi:tripartite-type tricarboxylate transporter receptor subunit TctC